MIPHPRTARPEAVLPWREAKVVAVFGDHLPEALPRLRLDAERLGFNAYTVVDTGSIGNNSYKFVADLYRGASFYRLLPRRDGPLAFMRTARLFAEAIGEVVLADLRFASADRTRTMLAAADFGIAALESNRYFLVQPRGKDSHDKAVIIPFSLEGATS